MYGWETGIKWTLIGHDVRLQNILENEVNVHVVIDHRWFAGAAPVEVSRYRGGGTWSEEVWHQLFLR